MSGSIMQFAPVAAPAITPYQDEAQKWADLAKTQAATGLIGAQAQEAQANIPLTQARTQTELEQPALVRANVGLIGSQSELARAQAQIGVPATAAANLGSAASSYAMAGKTGQEAFADRLNNLTNVYGTNQAGIIGTVPQPPPISGGGQQLPIGPAINAPLPPEAKGFLRALSPGEGTTANVMSGGGTFDPTQGHPGSGHAGLYQLGAEEWAEGATRLGINPKNMTADNQALVAWDLASTRYRKITGDDLLTDLRAGVPATKIAAALSPTWTSLPSGAETNKTGATFIQRLPLTIQHEKADVAKAPEPGVPGPEARATPAPPPPETPPPTTPPKAGSVPQDLAGRAQPVDGPSGGPDFVSPHAFYNPNINTGLPIPKSYLVAGNGANTSLLQRAAGWNAQRQADIPRIFQAAAGSTDPSDVNKYNAGVEALYNNGFLFNSQRQSLLGHPEMAAQLMQGQLPVSEQPATRAAQAEAGANVQLIAQERSKLAGEADAAQQQNSILNQMRAYQHAAGSGPMDPELAKIGGVLSQAGEAIGLGPSRAVSDWAQLQALQSDLLRAKVQGTGNVRAQSEWNILGNSIASLSDPTIAFQTKAMATQAMNDFTQAKNAAFAESKMLPDQFAEKWNSFVDPMAFIVRRLATDPGGQAAAQQIYQSYKANGQLAEWNDIKRQASLIDRNGIYHLAPIFKSAAAAQ